MCHSIEVFLYNYFIQMFTMNLLSIYFIIPKLSLIFKLYMTGLLLYCLGLYYSCGSALMAMGVPEVNQLNHIIVITNSSFHTHQYSGTERYQPYSGHKRVQNPNSCNQSTTYLKSQWPGTGYININILLTYKCESLSVLTDSTCICTCICWELRLTASIKI